MAAKRRSLAFFFVAIAMSAASPALASIAPNTTLQPPPIDFRYEVEQASDEQPFAVFTNPRLHAFEDVAGISVPRPSISTQLERRIGNIELARTAPRTSVFTLRVSEKLAS